MPELDAALALDRIFAPNPFDTYPWWSDSVVSLGVRDDWAVRVNYDAPAPTAVTLTPGNVRVALEYASAPGRYMDEVAEPARKLLEGDATARFDPFSADTICQIAAIAELEGAPDDPWNDHIETGFVPDYL